LAAQVEKRPGQRELGMAVRPVGAGDAIGPREQTLTRGKIHRTAVIGVDQRQVPQLRALVEVGHTGNPGLEHELRQTVERAQQCDAPGERLEIAEELA